MSIMKKIDQYQDYDLSPLLLFLQEEGLSPQEKEVLLNKTEEIYLDINENNQRYSIFDVSRILMKLFDDQFYNAEFVIALLTQLIENHKGGNCFLGMLY